jgi:hypothetical protein
MPVVAERKFSIVRPANRTAHRRLASGTPAPGRVGDEIDVFKARYEAIAQNPCGLSGTKCRGIRAKGERAAHDLNDKGVRRDALAVQEGWPHRETQAHCIIQ